MNQHIIVSEENHLTGPAPCSHKGSRGKAASTRGTRNSPTDHEQLSAERAEMKDDDEADTLEVCWPGVCNQKPPLVFCMSTRTK